ncbi:MAG: ubiquitin carboxyl-terminal hydrolase [Verrucomicrobiota bacterium]|nr:ubiquitin carboxyl-terminal hydrolase [Verrucomicrobiota bacterium]
MIPPLQETIDNICYENGEIRVIAIKVAKAGRKNKEDIENLSERVTELEEVVKIGSPTPLAPPAATFSQSKSKEIRQMHLLSEIISPLDSAETQELKGIKILKYVSSDGGSVKLSDGSIFRISNQITQKAKEWPIDSVVLITPNKRLFTRSPYRLINPATNTTAGGSFACWSNETEDKRFSCSIQLIDKNSRKLKLSNSLILSVDADDEMIFKNWEENDKVIFSNNCPDESSVLINPVRNNYVRVKFASRSQKFYRLYLILNCLELIEKAKDSRERLPCIYLLFPFLRRIAELGKVHHFSEDSPLPEAEESESSSKETKNESDLYPTPPLTAEENSLLLESQEIVSSREGIEGIVDEMLADYGIKREGNKFSICSDNPSTEEISYNFPIDNSKTTSREDIKEVINKILKLYILNDMTEKAILLYHTALRKLYKTQKIPINKETASEWYHTIVDQVLTPTKIQEIFNKIFKKNEGQKEVVSFPSDLLVNESFPSQSKLPMNPSHLLQNELVMPTAHPASNPRTEAAKGGAPLFPMRGIHNTCTDCFLITVFQVFIMGDPDIQSHLNRAPLIDQLIIKYNNNENVSIPSIRNLLELKGEKKKDSSWVLGMHDANEALLALMNVIEFTSDSPLRGSLFTHRQYHTPLSRDMAQHMSATEQSPTWGNFYIPFKYDDQDVCPIPTREGKIYFADLLDSYFFRVGDAKKENKKIKNQNGVEETISLAREVLKLESPLNSLSFALSRFHKGQKLMERDDAGRVIDRQVEVPKILEMGPEKFQNGASARYELHGFIVHLGDGLSSGHYISCVSRLCSDGSRSYFLCNDDRIEPLSEEKFLEWAKSAYILHYRKLSE